MLFFSLYRQRILLCILFTGLLLYSFTGELVDYNEGAGWDGMTYYSIVKDFDVLIRNRGIDSYHMTRILPFAINHYILSFLNIEITIQSAVICARLLNLLFLVMLVFYFFSISDELSWNRKTEIIAFSFCFFNVPILKMFGYLPLSTDCSALLFSYMGIYYYLKRNYWWMGGTVLLSMLTWPILSIVLFILAIFPRYKVIPVDGSGLSLAIRCIYVLYVPLVYFVPIIASKFGYFDLNVSTSVCRPPMNMVMFYLAMISTICFYIVSTRVLVVNWNSIFKHIFNKSFLMKFFFFSVLFSILLYGIISMGGNPQHTVVLQLVCMVTYSASDILIFLETPFLYLGLFFLLILLLWKKIVRVVCENYGIGYFLVLMLALFFLMDIETRKLTSFYPIMLVPLMDCLQKMNLRTTIVYFIPVVCIFCSFFWFPINTPDIGMAFNQPYSTYVEFPAQRLFMFLGPWQSHLAYLIVASIEVIIGSFLVIMSKKGMFTTEHQN